MNINNKEFHLVANIFPLMQGEEFDNLCQDIKTKGLIESIWLHPNNSIIDGRNRYRACQEIGIEPHFRTWNGEGSLINFVLSLNLHRRHLTSGQRAAIAVEIEYIYAKEAKERQGARNDLDIVEKIPLSEKGKARDQAAKALNTNGRYVSDAKRIKKASPEIFEQVKFGNMTIKEALEKLFNIHFSSDKIELYTPQDIVEKIVSLLKLIDLDPCSNSKINPNIPAKIHYTKDDNGLKKKWHGRVFVNPPYGNLLPLWINKAIDSYESKDALEIVILVPARTDTRWFRKLRNYPKCFIFGRLKFKGASNNAPFPSMLSYLGKDANKFCRHFRDIGDIYYWEKVTDEGG